MPHSLANPHAQPLHARCSVTLCHAAAHLLLRRCPGSPCSSALQADVSCQISVKGVTHLCTYSAILLLSWTGLSMPCFSRHAWECRTAIFHACWSSPSAHCCLLQPILTLPCLQPHTLVLVAYEGKTMLQRSTGLCPSLSWGELVLSWADKHPVTQLGSPWVDT